MASALAADDADSCARSARMPLTAAERRLRRRCKGGPGVARDVTCAALVTGAAMPPEDAPDIRSVVDREIKLAEPECEEPPPAARAGTRALGSNAAMPSLWRPGPRCTSRTGDRLRLPVRRPAAAPRDWLFAVPGETRAPESTADTVSLLLRKSLDAAWSKPSGVANSALRLCEGALSPEGPGSHPSAPLFVGGRVRRATLSARGATGWVAAGTTVAEASAAIVAKAVCGGGEDGRRADSPGL